MKLELFRYYCYYCDHVWELFLDHETLADCIHCGTPCTPTLIAEE